MSTTKEPQSAHQIPLMVTINNTSRHEILFINLGTTLPALRSRIVKAISVSPNAEEFLAKYKKRSGGSSTGEEGRSSGEGKGEVAGGGAGMISRVRVRWSDVGRDMKIWPKSTELTEDNLGAVLVILQQSGVGKDVIEVEVDESGDVGGKEEQEKGEEEGEAK